MGKSREQEPIEPELMESEKEETGTPQALGLITRAEIDSQISTARAYPRNALKAVADAKKLVTSDESTAEECIYTLKRYDSMSGETKLIEGPSARFAEILAYSWGNSRAEARTIDEGEKFVTAQGMFVDLEKNVGIRYEVRRRITTKSGKRYGDDMIGTTANAACSIALRNAVLKGIPKALWRPIYQAAKEVAIGTLQTLQTRRQAAIEYFTNKMGVDLAQILEALQVESVDGITLDHLATLKGIVTSVKNNEMTIDEAFSRQTSGGSKAARSKLNEELDKQFEAAQEQHVQESQQVAVQQDAAPAQEEPAIAPTVYTERVSHTVLVQPAPVPVQQVPPQAAQPEQTQPAQAKPGYPHIATFAEALAYMQQHVGNRMEAFRFITWLVQHSGVPMPDIGKLQKAADEEWPVPGVQQTSPPVPQASVPSGDSGLFT